MKYYRAKALCQRSLVKAPPFAVLLASLVLSGCPSRHAAESPNISDSEQAPVAGTLPQNEAAGQGAANVSPLEPTRAASAREDFPVSTLLPIYNASIIAQDVAVGYGLAAVGAHAAAGQVSPSPFGNQFADASAVRGLANGSVGKGFVDNSAALKKAPPPSDDANDSVGKGVADNSPALKKAPPPSDGARRQRVSLVRMTLRDAVGLAIAHHPDVSRAEAVVRQSASEVSVAKAAWFPVLNYTVTPGYGSAYSRDTAAGTQISGGISQLVYDFGKTPGRIGQADATLNRQRHVLNSTIEDVAYTAASHYVEFSAAQATMDAAQEAITNLNKLRKVIADRVKASLSSASDLTQADVALQRAAVDLTQAQTRLNVAADNLAEIIGMRPQSVADLVSVDQAVSALANDNVNIENTPSVLAAKAAVLEAEAQVKVVKSDYYPAVSLVANKSTMTGGADNAYDTDWAGLALSGTISSVFQNRHRVASARANRDAMERQLESQRLSKRTELTSAETELEGAATRIEALDTMKKLSLKSRDLYWQEYTLGNRQLTQVLDAERDIFSTESSRIAAVADGMLARLKAQNAVGSLVSQLRGPDMLRGGKISR